MKNHSEAKVQHDGLPRIEWGAGIRYLDRHPDGEVANQYSRQDHAKLLYDVVWKEPGMGKGLISDYFEEIDYYGWKATVKPRRAFGHSNRDTSKKYMWYHSLGNCVEYK